MTLCYYSDMFGKPNTGFHTFRLFDLALIDLLFTFIFAYIFYYILNYKINYFLILIILFIFGILMHRLFCVKTTIDTILFG